MNKIIMCILFEKQILSDDTVSTIYCGVTNHPKTQYFKTKTVSVFHDFVAWLDSSSAGLA